MKRLESRVPNFLAISMASLITTLVGTSVAPQHLVDGQTQDVAVHHGHPLQVPVLGELADQIVDLGLILLGAVHEGLGEVPRLLVDRVPRPEVGGVR